MGSQLVNMRVIILLLGVCFSWGKEVDIVARIPRLCFTTEGERCMFPFKYGDKMYHKCTYTNSPTPWCPTLLDSDNRVVTNRWGDCNIEADSSCEVEPLNLPSCTTGGGPTSGKECLFPFVSYIWYPVYPYYWLYSVLYSYIWYPVYPYYWLY